MCTMVKSDITLKYAYHNMYTHNKRTCNNSCKLSPSSEFSKVSNSTVLSISPTLQSPAEDDYSIPDENNNQQYIQKKICDFFYQTRLKYTIKSNTPSILPATSSLRFPSSYHKSLDYYKMSLKPYSSIIKKTISKRITRNKQLSLPKKPLFYNFDIPPLPCDNNAHHQCQYLNLYLGKNIHDANQFTPVHNYFSYYEKCESSKRITPVTRKVVLLYLIEVGRAIPAPVSDFSLHMAINLFDRYLSSLGMSEDIAMKEKAAQELEIIGAACLFLSSKLEDCWTLSLSDICKTFDEGSERRKNDILYWEIKISQQLNFQLSCPTLYDFLYKMIDLTIPFLSENSLSITSSNAVNTEEQQTIPKEKSVVCNNKWSPETISAIVGPKEAKYLSYSYFSERENSNNLESQLLAVSASIGELVILHHASIGIPAHLLAAASLLMAIVKVFNASNKSISLLPQPVRIILGEDRSKLIKIMPIICAILEERETYYKSPFETSESSIVTTASSRS